MHNGLGRMRCLVLGLAGLIDEPVFLARELKNICGARTLFYVEGTDGRKPHAKLEVSQKQAPRSLFWSCLRLVHIILTFHPDVAEQYLATGSTLRDLAYTLILIVFRVRRVTHCIGGEILYWEGHSRLRRFGVRLSLRFSRAILLKEPYMPEYLRRYAIADASVCRYIPNAIDPDFYVRQVPAWKNPGGTVFLFFNSFKGFRNLDVLVEAANLLTARRPEAAFLIVGGRDAAELERVAALVSDPARISVQGLSNAKEFYYSLAEVFLLPADHVFLNVSLLEAMSLGLCPVLSDVPGARDIIEPGVSGLLAPNRDAAGLAAVLESLLDDPAGRERMGRGAALRARERFHVKDRARAHFAMYADVLAGKKNSGLR